jgi:hypothetical protein
MRSSPTNAEHSSSSAGKRERWSRYLCDDDSQRQATTRTNERLKEVRERKPHKNEGEVQRSIRNAYRQRGWITLKMDPDGRGIPNGWPDLLCIGPGGKKPDKLQQWTLDMLTRMGQRAYWTDNLVDAEIILSKQGGV